MRRLGAVYTLAAIGWSLALGVAEEACPDCTV
jgi:hypothetical protein